MCCQLKQKGSERTYDYKSRFPHLRTLLQREIPRGGVLSRAERISFRTCLKALKTNELRPLGGTLLEEAVGREIDGGGGEGT